MNIKHRVSHYKKNGYTVTVMKRNTHFVIKPRSSKHVYIGDRMPTELIVSQDQKVHVVNRTVFYSSHSRQPVTTQVVLYTAGGTVIETTKTCKVEGQHVLAASFQLVKARHLHQFKTNDRQAVHDIVADIGCGLQLTAVQLSASTAIHAASSMCIVLPYHFGSKSWTCSCCGAGFSTWKELAQHDGFYFLPNRSPRKITLSGKLGPTFKIPEYSHADQWKQKAISAIDDGRIETALALAPSLKHSFALKEIRYKLLKLSNTN
tara:strand:- start:272 stop:1057 length:786 start_codon:yes stop_codon:yes gene_type:complete